MKLLDRLELKAAKYSVDVDYDGNEVVLVCPDGYVFDKGTPTEIYHPWDGTPAVAMLWKALAEIDDLGSGIIPETEAFGQPL